MLNWIKGEWFINNKLVFVYIKVVNSISVSGGYYL